MPVREIDTPARDGRTDGQTKIESVSITAFNSRMTDRSTCWSLTEQVASREDAAVFMNQPVPPGWKLRGQLEEAPQTGQLHLQLMLETPRIRFGTVKKQFPRAHIEVARDKHALTLYVAKPDTRVAKVDQPPTPTIWEFNRMVADRINTSDFSIWILKQRNVSVERHPDAIYVDREWFIVGSNVWKSATSSEMMVYIDNVVSALIMEGVRGAEYMGVNPMFRSAWKTYGKALLERAAREAGEKIIEAENIYYNDEASGSQEHSGSSGILEEQDEAQDN